MSITWNTNIPAPTDLLSNSQGQLQQNTNAISAIFNDSTNGIFTKYVLQNVGTPSVAPVDPLSILYAKNGTGITFNGHPIPFFQNSVGEFPLMADIQTATGQGVYGFQLGNIILNYGIVTVAGSTLTVTLNKNYTSGTSYSVVITTNNGTALATDPTITNMTSTQFVMSFTGIVTAKMNIIAIGY